MKRSEMVGVINYFLHGNSQAPSHLDTSEALLNTIERHGMLPPDQNPYDRVDAEYFIHDKVNLKFYHNGNEVPQPPQIPQYKWEPENG